MSRRIGASATGLVVLLPGVLVAGFAFAAGGFFPDAVAIATLALGLALVARATLARRPLEGLSAPYALAAGALGLLAAWTLASSAWSQAPARAIVEYDRVLLYLLAFVLAGAVGRTAARLRWALRGLALAAVAVCAAGFASRALPELWTVAPSVNSERLSFPLTYWNALGLLASLGLVACFALTADAREAPAGRVLAAAALPLLAATLVLTFSRGAFAAAIAGLVAVVAVGRPGALLSAALVGAPALAVALRAALGADELAVADPTTAAAVEQGAELARIVAACALGAAAGRSLALVLDARVARLRPPARLRRRGLRAAANLAPAAALLALAVALGVPGELASRYEGFFAEREAETGGPLRERLLAPGNNGRIAHWEVALGAFSEHPWRGDGAGTYALRWDRDRPQSFQVEDAHSLYLELLGELGLPGLALLAVALALMLGGFAWRARGPERVVGAALLAAGLAWALHAGVDWHWEMPAVTAWLFAAGGLALAAPAGRAAQGDPAPARPDAGRALRLAAALGTLALLALPLAVLRSQGPLRDAARAYARGDCAAAIDRALAARDALAVRPEPYVLLGFCDARLGRARLAVEMLEQAVRLEPGNWENHYGLALARAVAGLDPRPQARAAARRNPSDSDLATALVRMLDSDDPRVWRRRALRAELPLR